MTSDHLQQLQTQSNDQFAAKVLADSVNECGNRLMTWEVTYPRIIHSERLRHRMMSCNAASSRAIPVEQMLKAIREKPFLPMWWGAAQAGMQAFGEVEQDEIDWSRAYWVTASENAVHMAERLLACGLHKQIPNRILEPFSFTTEIISTTSFRHFELLRDHKMAEPHICKLAQLMASARSQSIPEALKEGEWHLPLVYSEDRSKLNLIDLKKVSVARCARVSYVRQHVVKDYEEDFKLYERLVGSDPRHSSCTEHQATPAIEINTYAGVTRTPIQCANFLGWKQHRQEIEGEFVPDELYTGPTLPYGGREEFFDAA